MIKALAPQVVLAASLFAGPLLPLPALATTCPSGQIFRVSLNICAPRAENLKYLRSQPKKYAVRHEAKPSRDNEFAALRTTEPPPEEDTTPAAAYAPAPAPAPMTPFAPVAQPVSPYGALPSPSSFH